MMTNTELENLETLIRIGGVERKSFWTAGIGRNRRKRDLPPLCSEYIRKYFEEHPAHVEKYFNEYENVNRVVAVDDIEIAKKTIHQYKTGRTSKQRTDNKKAIKVLKKFLEIGEIVKGMDWSVGKLKTGDKIREVPIFCRKYFKHEFLINPERIQKFLLKNPKTKTVIALENKEAAQKAIDSLNEPVMKNYISTKFFIEFAEYRVNVKYYVRTNIVVNHNEFKKFHLTDYYIKNFESGVEGYAIYKALQKCFSKQTLFKIKSSEYKLFGNIYKKYADYERIVAKNIFIHYKKISFSEEKNIINDTVERGSEIVENDHINYFIQNATNNKNIIKLINEALQNNETFRSNWNFDWR